MNNTSKLESGKTYSLSQIFSTDFTIAIPDLQRDYCWGLETYNKKGTQQGELVSKFLQSLKEKWKESSVSKGSTLMGLIYGYEWPKGTYQLCDGQQRITTFYLLVGELHRSKLDSDDVKKDLSNILSSRLQYSIRETTLYFLSDLVTKYFLENNCDLKFYTLDEREKHHLILEPNNRPSWYFMEYDLDPTIQSMLGAIYTIRKFLNESFKDNASDITSFAQTIANQFSFIYYDMGNRVRGEETFVVLNTSGEPLTATENLKPLLIAQLSANEKLTQQISDEWEEREDWFWKHRSNNELTSDNLSKDFYTWWLLLNGKKDSVDSVDLLKDYASRENLKGDIGNIHKLFNSLLETIKWIKSTECAKSILTAPYKWNDSQIDLSEEKTILTWMRTPGNREIVLPLLYFHQKFETAELLHMLRRLAKNSYYDKENEHVKFRDIVNIINASTTSAEVLKHTVWYNNDEESKDRVFDNRIEELIEFETDSNLRFDLNVLWKAKVQSVEEARQIRGRLNELHELAQGKRISGYDEQTAISMSNHYRLLKYLNGWGRPNGKQDYVSWKYWGTWFSGDSHSRNLEKAYQNDEFVKLLRSTDLATDIINQTRETISKYSSEDIFSEKSLSEASDIMRAWLISKFLVNEYADKHLISSYNDYPLCVNQVNNSDNLLNKDLPVSIGNLCLCFVKKSGPCQVEQKDYNVLERLDVPLYVELEDVSYDDFTNRTISDIVINQTSERIKFLFEVYIAPNNNSIQ